MLIFKIFFFWLHKLYILIAENVKTTEDAEMKTKMAHNSTEVITHNLCTCAYTCMLHTLK